MGSKDCYEGSCVPKNYAKEVSEALLETDFEMLEDISNEIVKSKKLDRTIFTAGNGGSSVTASHMINDLIKGCRIGDREGFRAICLNDSTALITCLANDFCYEDIYSILLRTLAKAGDLLIVFSGSGNSPNIVKVCETAKMMGITIIAFGGRDGGQMKALCDYCLLAQTYSMEQIEDLHMVYVHSLVSNLVEKLQYVWDVEVINYPQSNPFDIAIFDFDGTVSLIREGWHDIMYDYFTEELLKCPDAPPKEEVSKIVVDFVDILTGKQTIFQCIHLSEEIKKYGGVPKEALEYKTEYLRRLAEHTKQRIKNLQEGMQAEPFLVLGVVDTLKALKERNVKCYLTSGTDEVDVIEEAKLLGVAQYFESIHGATDANSTSCSKEQVLQDLIQSKGMAGSDFITFGDGFVEIELAKSTGGYAVAVATNEQDKDTSVDAWKREKLIKAGADCVIPDFSNTRRLMDFLFRR